VGSARRGTVAELADIIYEQNRFSSLELYGVSVPMVRRGLMKLVRFEDINGRETFVNAERVNHVSDYGSGTTEINFGDEQATVYVAMEVSKVAASLLKAAKPD
jgi:hypothetical protein